MEDKIDVAFNNIIKKLKKDGIVIIMEPIPTPNGWFDNTLNKNSDKFDISKWLVKKKQLEDEHDYFISLSNITYNKYDDCRTYIYINK